MATTDDTITGKPRPRRRAVKPEGTEMAESLSETPATSVGQEDISMSSQTELPGRPSLTRRLLFPLKEAYFVGIGAADWMLEKAVVIERNLSERGHRRNEMLGRVASKMGATVSDKTRSMSDRGRAKMQKMGERASEGTKETETKDEILAAQPA